MATIQFNQIKKKEINKNLISNLKKQRNTILLNNFFVLFLFNKY